MRGLFIVEGIFEELLREILVSKEFRVERLALRRLEWYLQRCLIVVKDEGKSSGKRVEAGKKLRSCFICGGVPSDSFSGLAGAARIKTPALVNEGFILLAVNKTSDDGSTLGVVHISSNSCDLKDQDPVNIVISNITKRSALIGHVVVFKVNWKVHAYTQRLS